MATTNANFKVKNGLDAVGVVTSAGLSLLSTTSPITLNGSTGTSGQILTSAGTGATPTWSSSFSGFLSTTNTGRTGLVGFITPGSSSQATWANYPVGLSTMVNANQESNGAPSAGYQYFFKVANRDFGGGWGGISIDYNTGDFYVGRANTSSDYATWHKLANTSLANTFSQPLSITPSGNVTALTVTQNAGGRSLIFGASGLLNTATSVTGNSSWNSIATSEVYGTLSTRVVELLRGISNQTSDTLQIQSSAGTVLAGFNAQGQIFTGATTPIQGSIGVAIGTQTPTGTTNISITTGATHGISVGQTVVIAGVSPVGYNGTWTAQSGTTGTTLVVNIGSNPGAITVAGTVTQNSQVGIVAPTANNTPLVVRSAASQVANPLEVQNSSGTVIANVTSAGGVRATGTLQGSTISAVADGSTIATLSSSGNVQFRGAASYGSGVGVIGIANATTAPSTPPTGGGILFVNAGALQYRGTSGSNATIINADGTNPLSSTNNTFSGVNTFNNSTAIGTGFASSTGLEIGYTGGTATTPFIDFHSGATNIDYDSRIIASGGNGTNGQGTLTYTAATNTFTGNISTSAGLSLTGANSPINLTTGGNGTAGQVIVSAGSGSTPIWGVPTYPSTAQQLFLASPTSGSGTPTFRYISTSDFTQFASPTTGQALVAAPVTGGWAWSSFLSTNGGSVSNNISLTGTLALSGASSPLTVNGLAGTSGQILTSAGAGATPTWTTPASHTLIASSSFSSAPSFTSIPQTYKRLYVVIVFATLGTFSGALTYTVNGAGTGYSRFQPGVSTAFTTSAGAAAVLTLASTAPVVGDSYWVEINNYTQTNSRSIGNGSVYTFGNLIPAAVTSFAFAAATSWGGATGTAYLYGVN